MFVRQKSQHQVILVRVCSQCDDEGRGEDKDRVRGGTAIACGQAKEDEHLERQPKRD